MHACVSICVHLKPKFVRSPPEHFLLSPLPMRRTAHGSGELRPRPLLPGGAFSGSSDGGPGAFSTDAIGAPPLSAAPAPTVKVMLLSILGWVKLIDLGD